MKKDLYYATVAYFNEKGFGEGRGWGFYVSPEKCDPFTIEVAKQMLTWATEEFNKRFDENMDFNYVCVKMGDRAGKYWRDRNRLMIFKDGYPIYENNNGIICKDPVALADTYC